MPTVDRETLQKILLELLQVVQEIRAFIPSDKTSPEAPKLLPRVAVSKLPPAPPGHLKMPQLPGAQKKCVLCPYSKHMQRDKIQYMANIVFYPCRHCVVCQDCWKEFYAVPGTNANGNASIYARPNKVCEHPTCRMKVQYAIALKHYKDENREDEVRYGQKNEYLGDSAAVV
jgi:hypothetical protein